MTSTRWCARSPRARCIACGSRSPAKQRAAERLRGKFSTALLHRRRLRARPRRARRVHRGARARPAAARARRQGALRDRPGQSVPRRIHRPRARAAEGRQRARGAPGAHARRRARAAVARRHRGEVPAELRVRRLARRARPTVSSLWAKTAFERPGRPAAFQAEERRSARRASSSGASAISEWPENSITTPARSGSSPASAFAARGGVITSRLPRMKSAGHFTLAGQRVVVARLEVGVQHAGREALQARLRIAVHPHPGIRIAAERHLRRVAPDRAPCRTRRTRCAARGLEERLAHLHRVGRGDERDALDAAGVARGAASSATSVPMEWPTMLASAIPGASSTRKPSRPSPAIGGERRARRSGRGPGRSSASTLQPW